MTNKKLFKLESGIKNWEVLAQKDGCADVTLKGIFLEDTSDDTEQIMQFSQEKVCVRVVKESDGAAVTPDIPISVKNNRFSVKINKIPIGGPYSLDAVMLDRENRIEYPLRGEKVHHFCVGDVFLIAGQSNAAGMGKGIVEEEPNVGVHVLRDLQTWDIATQPFNDFDYSKQSMFLAFAKKYKKLTGHPVGIIPAAMGGAPISRWLPGKDLYTKALLALKKCSNINGVMWYQGCADAGENCKTYLPQFKAFVCGLRKDIKNNKLPFFTFQLNRQHIKEPSESLDVGYSTVREAQRIAAKTISGVYILPALDGLHMTDFIHGSKYTNIMLGERLAYQAANKLCGIKNFADAPEIESAVLLEDKKTVVLAFSDVMGFLDDHNANLCEYPIRIHNEIGMCKIVKAELSANKVKLVLENECTGKLYADAHYGVDPKNLLIDFKTQMPILAFSNYLIQEEKQNET